MSKTESLLLGIALGLTLVLASDSLGANKKAEEETDGRVAVSSAISLLIQGGNLEPYTFQEGDKIYVVEYTPLHPTQTRERLKFTEREQENPNEGVTYQYWDYYPDGKVDGGYGLVPQTGGRIYQFEREKQQDTELATWWQDKYTAAIEATKKHLTAFPRESALSSQTSLR